MLKTIKKSEGWGSKTIWYAVGAIFVLRILFMGLMGLMPQDAYYYFYAQHPALSYLDHPPMLAYLIRLFTGVFGAHVFIIKLTDTVISLLSVISFYLLSRRFLGGHGAQRSLLLFFSTLMLTIISLISTPDVPLILFWCLSLLALYQAVFLEKKMYWIWTGIMMGLAFDSKYTAIFLPAGLILFLLLSRKYRRLIFSPWPWISAIFFLITILPVIIWNIQNNLASLSFHSSSRFNSSEHPGSLNPLNLLGVLGHQAAILMPILFFVLLIVLYKSFKRFILQRTRVPAEQLFLFCFFVPCFFGFLAISPIYWININWMMPAYITGIILVGMYASRKMIRYQLLFSLGVHLLLAVEVIFYPVPIKSDDTWVGWKELATKVQEVKARYPDDFIFSADEYKTTAVLDFYFDEMVYGRNVIGDPALQFDHIGTDLNSLKGKNALFINSIPGLDPAPEKKFPPWMAERFTTITELEPILISKGGRLVRKFLLFRCTNYLPPVKK